MALRHLRSMVAAIASAALLGSAFVATPAQAATPVPECPPTLHCIWPLPEPGNPESGPAAYILNNPADLSDWGNYDKANRPVSNKINSVVIHDTEGDLRSTLNHFRNPRSYVSAHYVIDPDGTVTQMVQTKDIAWHAGNWRINQEAIGIENVGHGATGLIDYTPAMYYANAELVKYLAIKFNIPLDRQHIRGSVIGHDNVPATRPSGIAGMHNDPGPFWNWQHLFTLLGKPVLPTAGLNSPIVAVAPVWQLNKQPVTGCGPNGVCVPSAPGPFTTNLVYLHTTPSLSAPLLSDPMIGQGTTDIENVAAKAYYGQRFAVADKKIEAKGIWYQVWYGGQLGWFFSPWLAPTAFPVQGKYVTPKAGVASVPIYGRAVPELSEYPANFVPPPGSISPPTPLPYTMTTGQRMAVVDESVKAEWYFNWSFDKSGPYDGTNFAGATKYIAVQVNGRLGYVKQSDVVTAG